MATIYEVSKRAGVSLATVSRVVNNSANVSAATRSRVLAAVAELGYRPNWIAQSLASRRSNAVGILVPELHGPFFGTLVSGIEEVLREAGRHAIVTVGHSDVAKEKAGIEFLVSRGCDALILHVDAVADDWLETLSRGPVPLVVVNRGGPALGAACITLDNRRGGWLATHSVIELGHRDIAYVAGPAWKRDAEDRLAGHRAALADAGIPFDPRLAYRGDYHEASGGEALRHFLTAGLSFSAMVCANDGMAAGAMRAAREAGLGVPEHLSLIGFDNVNFARYLYPRLSTVDYPARDIGAMAARWVLKHVYETGDEDIRTVFEPRLVLRESLQERAD